MSSLSVGSTACRWSSAVFDDQRSAPLMAVSVHSMQGNQVLRFSPNDLSYMSITARMNSREDCPEGIAFAKGCLYVAR